MTDSLFSQRVIAPDDVLVRVLEDEAVILNLESETYFGLDDVGTRMWTLLTESASVQTAYDQLLDEYDVDSEQLSTDLVDLIRQLEEHGLATLQDVEAG